MARESQQAPHIALPRMQHTEENIKRAFFTAAIFGASTVITGSVAIAALQKPSLAGVFFTLGAATTAFATIHQIGKGALAAAIYARGKITLTP